MRSASSQSLWNSSGCDVEVLRSSALSSRAKVKCSFLVVVFISGTPQRDIRGRAMVGPRTHNLAQFHPFESPVGCQLNVELVVWLSSQITILGRAESVGRAEEFLKSLLPPPNRQSPTPAPNTGGRRNRRNRPAIRSDDPLPSAAQLPSHSTRCLGTTTEARIRRRQRRG